MKEIFITGHSGFVGLNLRENFKNIYIFNCYSKNSYIVIKEQVVIHLAGKAHDLKKTLNANEYYEVNTELTKKVFDNFLESDSKIFIILSSVKAIADVVEFELTEDTIPSPVTDYGKSKLLAEQYILNSIIPTDKKVFILRPCMIHGSGNKGNLNLIYQIVKKGIPWPLGKYENQRSFCSIENLCFVIKELIEREDIPSGIYNISDNKSLSTNGLIKIISEALNKETHILFIPKRLIKFFVYVGDILNLPLNSERLQKLTESYVVSNKKLIDALGKPLPFSLEEGLKKTILSFKNDQ